MPPGHGLFSYSSLLHSLLQSNAHLGQASWVAQPRLYDVMLPTDKGSSQLELLIDDVVSAFSWK